MFATTSVPRVFSAFSLGMAFDCELMAPTRSSNACARLLSATTRAASAPRLAPTSGARASHARAQRLAKPVPDCTLACQRQPEGGVRPVQPPKGNVRQARVVERNVFERPVPALALDGERPIERGQRRVRVPETAIDLPETDERQPFISPVT